MTASENEPPESEIAPPMILDSRKAKIVVLFIAALSAANLFSGLYLSVRYPALFGGFTSRAERAFASAPVFFAVAVVPLYFGFKIWRRPTLKNLLRVPFIVAFLCYMGVVGVGVIVEVLFEVFEKSFTYTELLDAGMPLLMLLSLGTYFPVKNAMVLWFRTPELSQSVLQTKTRSSLWKIYCFFLWIFLMALGSGISSALGAGTLGVWHTGALAISVVVAIYVYKKGLRPLGLRPE